MYTVFLTEKDIELICLALTKALQGNTNEEAVRDFKNIRSRLYKYVSADFVQTCELMEMIQG